MDTTAPSPARARSLLGIASLVAGCLAIVLSLGGQLLAAGRLATDWNSGHPSASQPLIHAVSVTPSLIFSVLAVAIGFVACRRSRGIHKLAIAGITLGIIAAALTFTDVLGSFAAQLWIDPVPGER